jgi:hypothetical protein
LQAEAESLAEQVTETQEKKIAADEASRSTGSIMPSTSSLREYGDVKSASVKSQTHLTLSSSLQDQRSGSSSRCRIFAIICSVN